MVVILRTLFLRDLRDNWVFPRLVYATTGQAMNRNALRLSRFLIARPRDRAARLLATLRDEESFAEILLALFAVLVALVRAMGLLILAIVALYIALSRL